MAARSASTTSSTQPPYHRDPIKELAAEAKKQGLVFCLLFNTHWHYPAAYVDAPGKDPTAGNRTTKPAGWQEYLKYMKEQLRELVKGYDPGVLCSTENGGIGGRKKMARHSTHTSAV